MRSEWADRHQFAEVAEALGVPTDQVMGAMAQGGGYYVLYNPEPYEGEGIDYSQEIWAAVLRRDPDDVLVAVAQKKTDLTWAQIEAQIGEKMRAKFGEPGNSAHQTAHDPEDPAA